MRIRKRVTKPAFQQEIAKERIQILLHLAEKEFGRNLNRSIRYVELARKISLRYNVRMDKLQKSKFCKRCNSLMVPGLTSSVRLDSGRKLLIIKCKKCNMIYRQSYGKNGKGKKT